MSENKNEKLFEIRNKIRGDIVEIMREIVEQYELEFEAKAKPNDKTLFELAMEASLSKLFEILLAGGRKLDVGIILGNALSSASEAMVDKLEPGRAK